jgi:hypothetical protein
MSNIYQNFSSLDDKYKKLFYSYFKNYECINCEIYDNYILFYIENWGVEKIYFSFKSKFDKMYNVLNDNTNSNSNIAICIQIGNWNTFLKMEYYLENFMNDTIFYFVGVNKIFEENLSILNYLKSKYEKNIIISVENRGMDIGLFLINYHYILKKNIYHNYLFKIHTKTADDFRNLSLQILMGNQEIIRNNINILNNSNVGMVGGNKIHNYIDSKDLYNLNMYHIKKEINYIFKKDINYDSLQFVEGTMFIFKMNTFNRILTITNIEKIYYRLNNESTLDLNWYNLFYNLNNNNSSFIKEDYSQNITFKYCNNLKFQKYNNDNLGLRDYMIEHAYERLFGYFCKQNGLQIKGT